MELKDIIMKLNGSVLPTGCDSTDQDRMENLKKLCDLTQYLLSVIINDVAYDNKDCYEQSIKDMVDYANKWIDEQGISNVSITEEEEIEILDILDNMYYIVDLSKEYKDRIKKIIDQRG
jgi:hypothetical protein